MIVKFLAYWVLISFSLAFVWGTYGLLVERYHERRGARLYGRPYIQTAALRGFRGPVKPKHIRRVGGF